MKEMQDIWNRIPEKPFTENLLDSIVTRNSIFEMTYFKKTIIIELSVSIIILIFGLVTFSLVEWNFSFLIIFASSITILLNCYTLYVLKKINLKEDIKIYLQKSLLFIKTFIICFFMSIQIVVVSIVYLFKMSESPFTTWNTFIMSQKGLRILVLLIVIEIILIIYGKILYYNRWVKLNKLFRSLET